MFYQVVLVIHPWFCSYRPVCSPVSANDTGRLSFKMQIITKREWMLQTKRTEFNFEMPIQPSLHRRAIFVKLTKLSIAEFANILIPISFSIRYKWTKDTMNMYNSFCSRCYNKFTRTFLWMHDVIICNARGCRISPLCSESNIPDCNIAISGSHSQCYIHSCIRPMVLLR